MQFPLSQFMFGLNFRFGTDSVFTQQDESQGGTFPPTPGNFLLLDGTPFLLLDGTDFLLL